MRSRPLLLSDDVVAAEDITYTHLCTECALKKTRSERAKNTLFDREKTPVEVCVRVVLLRMNVNGCKVLHSELVLRIQLIKDGLKEARVDLQRRLEYI
jgi:hypothetical protein